MIVQAKPKYKLYFFSKPVNRSHISFLTYLLKFIQTG